MGRAADQQLERFAHGGDIGTNVGNIGDQQQRDDGVKKGPGVMGTQIGRQTMATDATNLGTDDLNTDHQRESEQ